MDIFNIKKVKQLESKLDKLKNPELHGENELIWDGVQISIQKLAKKVEYFEPDCIVAISVDIIAGGALVGDLLSQELKGMVPLEFAFFKQIEKRREFQDFSRNNIHRYNKILIVDDVVMSGNTINSTLQHINQETRNHEGKKIEVKFASITAGHQLFNNDSIINYSHLHYVYITKEHPYITPWGDMITTKQ